MTRYFYDCEFIEDGTTIDLVSIGIVADDGREYYAVSAEFDVAKLHTNPWLVANVRPSLPSRPERVGCRCMFGWHLDRDHPDVRTRAQIARGVHAFLTAGAGDVELWADYGAYDHVALCQLWGTMMDLPAGIPMWTHDLQQAVEQRQAVARAQARRGSVPPELVLVPQPAEAETEGLHNALTGARYARDLGAWCGHVMTGEAA